MGGSILGNFMNSLRADAEKRKHCNKEPNLNEGICKLTNYLDRPISVSEDIFSAKDEGWSSSLRNFLYGRSRSICVYLELWLTALELTSAARGEILGGNCKYKDFKEEVVSGRSGSRCKVDVQLSHWRNFVQRSSLSMSQSYEKNLQLCMQIVREIYKGLKITQVGRTTKVNLKQEHNICGNVYKALTEWVDEKFAEEILKNWFSTEDSEGKPMNTLQVAGTDLFEVISEDLIGDDAGIKDLKCKCEGIKGVGIQSIEKKFITEKTQDSITEIVQHLPSEDVTTEDSLSSTLQEYIQESNIAKGSEAETDDSSGSGPFTVSAGVSWGGMIGGGAVAVALGSLGVYGMTRIMTRGGRVARRGSKYQRAMGSVSYTPKP
ncbi:hypothetical protein C922_05464 [Plasmodium inui San Antonio 1]|uniref:Uncharacterized protein n=1 Tax=Plasmodium inui San Antonio 1 TaxID=1237626 RepID=W7AFT7_9APIC|nr:hypothetical protein C922_05464 [Plasmodium inui San Antonio 1]EUD64161.1 hypothetical protein C922_05464 [Plasmodium inui San Antonio 1]